MLLSDAVSLTPRTIYVRPMRSRDRRRARAVVLLGNQIQRLLSIENELRAMTGASCAIHVGRFRRRQTFVLDRHASALGIPFGTVSERTACAAALLDAAREAR
jgi:hypothetical protein